MFTFDDSTTLPTVSWDSSLGDSVTSALTSLSGDVKYLFALPLAWVGYRVVKKVINKIS